MKEACTEPHNDFSTMLYNVARTKGKEVFTECWVYEGRVGEGEYQNPSFQLNFGLNPSYQTHNRQP